MHRLIVAGLLAASVLLDFGSASAQSAPQPVSNDFAYRQRTEERLSALDYQLRGLTGQIEQLQFRLRQSETRIKKLNAELAKVKAAQTAAPIAVPAPASVMAPQGAAPTTGPQTTASQMTAPQMTAPGGVLPGGAPQAQYDAAQGLLRVGRFEEAEKAFRDFRTSYPDHQLAANAHYWIGETQYARQRYQQAATTFLEAWQADAQGPKAPDNLYKLGMALGALEKTNEACVSFAKLLSDYRGASSRLRAKAERERASLNCA